MPSTLLTQVRARPNFKPAAKGTVNKVRTGCRIHRARVRIEGATDPRVGTGKQCVVRSGPLQVDSLLRRRLKPRVVDLRRERHKRAHISLTL